MTSSLTCGLRPERSSSTLPSSFRQRTTECCTSRRIWPTDSRRWRTTQRSSTRCHKCSPRNMHAASAGTIPLSESNGPRTNESSLRETGIIQTLLRENGAKILNASALQNGLDSLAEGQAMFRLISELYPICRSITGDGLRQTLRRLQEQIRLELREVPTGTQVFDWTVPKEWSIRDAYVKNTRGESVVDFQKSNLHVVNYSVPVNRRMPFAELKDHLFALPAHPDWIPYRTSYYKESWGFCISQRQLSTLKDAEYEVCIDSTLEDGHLTYGEYFLPGEIRDEVLISCHTCHPSLCNDNLSGIALAASLARTERGQDSAHQAWSGADRRGRFRRVALQEKPPRECRDRPRGCACVAAFRAAAQNSGIFALRLRRTAVLLAGNQSSGRKAFAHSPRHFSGIPHIGGQPGIRSPGKTGGCIDGMPDDFFPPGKQPDVHELEPQV